MNTGFFILASNDANASADACMAECWHRSAIEMILLHAYADVAARDYSQTLHCNRA